MPYVNIQFGGKLKLEQKKEIAQKIAEIIEEVTGRPRDYTYTVIQEVSPENWGVGEKLLSELL